MEQADSSLILYAVIFMTALGLVLAGALAIANRFLWVYEDPRIGEVEELLPATNCGACGTAGCHPFAEALIAGDVVPANCTVSSGDARQEIAELLGVDAGDVEKVVARLACAGGAHVASNRSHYDGLDTCQAASIVAGGPKSCVWGCLGLADCEDVCDFDSISMNSHGLPVVNDDLCTACGDCVEVCPKNLFSLHPVSHKLWVACANLQNDELAESTCEVACTACERCAVDSPDGLIKMQNHLAVIDYSHNALASPVATERCPTGAIVWLDGKLGVRKGRESKRIIRKKSLPIS